MQLLHERGGKRTYWGRKFGNVMCGPMYALSMDLVLNISALTTYDEFMIAAGPSHTAEDVQMSNYMRQNGMPEGEWNDTLLCQWVVKSSSYHHMCNCVPHCTSKFTKDSWNHHINVITAALVMLSNHNVVDRQVNPCDFNHPLLLKLTNQTIVAHDVKSDPLFMMTFIDMLPHLISMNDDCAEWRTEPYPATGSPAGFLDVLPTPRCLARAALTCYPHPCPSRNWIKYNNDKIISKLINMV